ncbi:MAG: metallophosphoesterase [Deltaproteobacteria bacterium]|nr:metallophosphoesterase [Deltaproteobacteria bacterium]
MRFGLVTVAVCLISIDGFAEVVRGPVLHASTDGMMTISWDTEKELVGEVSYGDAGTQEIAAEDTPGTHHIITLTNLEPNKQYRFQIGGEEGANSGGTFRAGAVGDFPYRFTVSGDTRTQAFFHRVVIDRVLAARPDLHMNTGDLVSSGEESDDWDVFFLTEVDLLRHIPFLPVIGNHDKDENTFYDEIWCLPGVRDNPLYFSLKYANSLFLVLDYGEIGDGTTQQDIWVAGQLQDAKIDPEIRHIFPAYHVPPVSSGPHGNDDNEHMLGNLHQKFVEAGVKVVFNGHDHDYERSFYDGIYYVVAGAGGAPQGGNMATPAPNPQEYSQVFAFEFSFAQIDVDGDLLTLSAYNMDGDLIDRIEIP